MTSYAYQAVNAAGQPMRGTLAVLNQNEALLRIREMGLFPTKLTERNANREPRSRTAASPAKRGALLANISRISIPLMEGRVKAATLSVFTRQLATLIDAGMPLLRGLKILQQQETNPRLKRITGEIPVVTAAAGTPKS